MLDTKPQGNGEIRIHVVNINGKAYLGKQQFFPDPEGVADELIPGKVKMLTSEDWDILQKNAKAITKMLAAA